MDQAELEAFKRHLQEFRKYLRPVTGVFILSMLVSFHFSDLAIQFVKDLYTVKLVTIHPYEAFMTKVNISVYSASIVTFPVFILQVVRFFKPGMTEQEYRTVKRYIPVVFILSVLGGLTGFAFLSSSAVTFLKGVGVASGLQNTWSISNVISFLLRISLASVIIFNIPVMVMALVKSGLVSADYLKSMRRKFVAVAFLASALLSPPDLFSMFMLFIPTYGFFELGLFLSYNL